MSTDLTKGRPTGPKGRYRKHGHVEDHKDFDGYIGGGGTDWLVFREQEARRELAKQAAYFSSRPKAASPRTAYTMQRAFTTRVKRCQMTQRQKELSKQRLGVAPFKWGGSDGDTPTD